MEQEQEIEISFRLDGHGRTISTTTETNNAETPDQPPIRQYESHSTMMELCVSAADSDGKDDDGATGNSNATTAVVDRNHSLVDELLFDCEISDCGLMPRTFWVPSEGFEPRCSLERMALDIFQHHVAADTNYDPKTSGAEWWVQIRPSPEAGRYTMHAKSEEDDDQDMAKEGISFHWDKDEDLRILCGGDTYVHPHLSTVTYLTDIGAPTLTMNIRVNQMTGDYIMPGGTEGDDKVQGFLSWPKFGKHLCFDGRYLHAAPSDIMEEGAFQTQCGLPPEQNILSEDAAKTNSAGRKKLQRRHRRVTFLVNVCLNYKPFGVKPFPDTMINKLSGHGPGQSKVNIGPTKASSAMATSEQSATTHDVEVGPTTAKNVNTKEECAIKRFHWPMGDCSSKEFIKADVPLDFARKQASNGGNIRVTWQDKAGVQMSRANSQSDSAEAPDAERKVAEGGTADAADGEKDSKRPRLGEHV